MKLRKPCEHGMYDRHHLSEGLKVGDLTHCPGGVFLPDDTLAILIRKHPEHGYPYIEEVEPREGMTDDDDGWYIRVAPPSLSYRDVLSVREAE